MIRFLSIYAEDAFGYRLLSFNFATGLHQIKGENGSSKTSVFMTLIHCLMNRNPKGGKVEDVNNKVTGKPYHIEVAAGVGRDSYRFINSKKTGTVEIWRNGRDISLKRIPDNLKLIQEILGADFTLLCDLLYQSKDSTLDILETGTDRGRKQFINRVLKMAEIDEQAARMKQAEKDLAGKNGRISALAKQLEALELGLGEPVAVEAEVEMVGTEAEIAVLADEIGALSENRQRLDGELHKVKLQIATAEGEQTTRDRIAAIKAQHAKIPVWFKELPDTYADEYKPSPAEQAENTQDQIEEMQEEIQTFKLNANSLKQELARAGRVKEQLALLDEYRQALAKLGRPDKEKGECLDQLDKIVRVHASTTAKLADVQKRLIPYRKALADRVCPTCGSAENWERVKQLVADLEKEQAEHEALIEKCDGGKLKYRERLNLWERREKIEAEIGKLTMITPTDLDIPLAQQKLWSYERQIISMEKAVAEAKVWVADYHKAKELEGQIDKLRASLKGTELSDGMYLTEDTLAHELEQVIGCLENKALRLTHLKERLDTVKHHNATVRARLQVNRQIEEKNEQLRLQIDQVKKELHQAEKRLDCIREWNGILGNKGFRVARIKKFLRSLNATMAKYSQMICNGKIKAAFYINDEGEVEFTISDAAKEMDYPLWSGGEKARVRLVTLFAVLELLEVMGSVSFNVLCLDEVFDALDAEGKEGLFRVLEYLKQKGKAIYVIAHSELALDLSYDSVIQAAKHQDGTTEIIQ